jgi:hypothetical protein
MTSTPSRSRCLRILLFILVLVVVIIIIVRMIRIEILHTSILFCFPINAIVVLIFFVV